MLAFEQWRTISKRSKVCCIFCSEESPGVTNRLRQILHGIRQKFNVSMLIELAFKRIVVAGIILCVLVLVNFKLYTVNGIWSSFKLYFIDISRCVGVYLKPELAKSIFVHSNGFSIHSCPESEWKRVISHSFFVYLCVYCVSKFVSSIVINMELTQFINIFGEYIRILLPHHFLGCIELIARMGHTKWLCEICIQNSQQKSSSNFFFSLGWFIFSQFSVLFVFLGSHWCVCVCVRVFMADSPISHQYAYFRYECHRIQSKTRQSNYLSVVLCLGHTQLWHTIN